MFSWLWSFDGVREEDADDSVAACPWPRVGARRTGCLDHQTHGAVFETGLGAFW